MYIQAQLRGGTCAGLTRSQIFRHTPALTYGYVNKYAHKFLCDHILTATGTNVHTLEYTSIFNMICTYMQVYLFAHVHNCV